MEHLPRLSRPKRDSGQAAGRRPVREHRKIDTAQESWLRYAAFSPLAVYLTRLLESRDTKTTGRPRQYDDFAMAVIALLAGRYRLRHITDSFLNQPGSWRIVCEAYEHHFGPDLPDEMDCAPSRSQYMHFRKTRFNPLMDAVHKLQRSRAMEIALTMGALGATPVRRLLEPDRAHTVYGDGTALGAVKKRSKIALGSRLIPGVVPDHLDGYGLTWHMEGGATEQTLGHHYAAIHVRDDDTTNRRITLDVRPVREQPEGGEAALGARMICDLHDLLGGDGRIDLALWDGAMRGTHASAIMRHTGALPAHRVRDDDKPRTYDLIRDCHCGQTHEIFTAGQTFCFKTVDGEGHITYPPAPRQKVAVRGATGAHRVYVSFDLPCGARSPLIRVDHTDKDHPRKINVAERVQPLAPHQPGWRYGWRADAEVSHSELDRSLPWKRMPYYRVDNQDMFMRAHVMLNNERAYGEYLTRRHEAADPAA